MTELSRKYCVNRHLKKRYCPVLIAKRKGLSTKRIDTATPRIQTIVDQPRVLEDNDDGIQRLELAGGLEDLFTPATPANVHTPVETVEQDHPPSTLTKMTSQKTVDYLIGREIA